MSATDVKNLLLHMEWADAATWRALLSVPSLAHDVPMQERLQHYHWTQWGYLQVLRGLPLEIPERGTFADLKAIGRWARRFYLELPAYRDALSGGLLAQVVVFPWADQVARRIGGAGPATVGECLWQLALHTAHHRGQVLARLRESGGEPPLTDFIAWIWMRRPAPDWGRLEED